MITVIVWHVGVTGNLVRAFLVPVGPNPLAVVRGTKYVINGISPPRTKSGSYTLGLYAEDT